MGTTPLLDLVEQPDPASLQHGHRDREVRMFAGQTVDLLTTHTQHRRHLGDTCEPEIHPRRLGILYPGTHRMGNVRHPISQLLRSGATEPMHNRSSISGRTTQHRDTEAGVAADDVVELHWMQEPDVTMATDWGLSVPALCGAWMEPDEPLAAAVTTGQTAAAYVDCPACEVLRTLA